MDLQLEDRVDQWLKDEFSLRFDPFRARDAADDDPNLNRFLVDDATFPALWGNWPTFVFAPKGGGKTTFRLRLLYACRSREDGLTVFPISLPTLTPSADPDTEIVRAAALELILHLLYFPQLFLQLNPQALSDVHGFLAQWLPLGGGVIPRLDEIEGRLSTGDSVQALDDFARSIGMTSVGFLTFPAADDIRQLVKQLREAPKERAVDPQAGLATLSRVLTELGYEAIYILVDGVDVYPNAARKARDAFDIAAPYLRRVRGWAEQRIYAKFFLPENLQPILAAEPRSLLTENAKLVMMEWTPERLRQVVRRRLLVAGPRHRAISSLDMLSDPSLRDAEGLCIDVLAGAHLLLPRELLTLLEQVFVEHVRPDGPPRRKLSRSDVTAAAKWYGQQQTFRTASSS